MLQIIWINQIANTVFNAIQYVPYYISTKCSIFTDIAWLNSLAKLSKLRKSGPIADNYNASGKMVYITIKSARDISYL